MTCDGAGMTGGPLYDGDIEECNGKTRIVCPWHGYAFDVHSGLTDFGLPVSLMRSGVTVHKTHMCTLKFQHSLFFGGAGSRMAGKAAAIPI